MASVRRTARRAASWTLSMSGMRTPWRSSPSGAVDMRAAEYDISWVDRALPGRSRGWRGRRGPRPAPRSGAPRRRRSPRLLALSRANEALSDPIGEGGDGVRDTGRGGPGRVPFGRAARPTPPPRRRTITGGIVLSPKTSLAPSLRSSAASSPTPSSARTRPPRARSTASLRKAAGSSPSGATRGSMMRSAPALDGSEELPAVRRDVVRPPLGGERAGDRAQGGPSASAMRRGWVDMGKGRRRRPLSSFRPPGAFVLSPPLAPGRGNAPRGHPRGARAPDRRESSLRAIIAIGPVEWTKGRPGPMVEPSLPREITTRPERTSSSGLDPRRPLIRITPPPRLPRRP